MINVNVDLSQINKAIKNIGFWENSKAQAVKDVVNTSALNVQRGAKKRCPVDSGRLRASIRVEPFNDGYTMQVGTNVKYAPYIEYGTGLFAVGGDGRKTPWAFPKKMAGKKDYNFKTIEIDGEEFYVTRGSKPHPFLFPAWEQERPEYIKAMRGALRK